MSKNPASPVKPAGCDMQTARDDAGSAARAEHWNGACGPLAVDLRGVRKSFGSVQAVRGVALTGLFAVSRPVGEVLERAGITAIAGRAVGKCSGENSSGCASPWH